VQLHNVFYSFREHGGNKGTNTGFIRVPGNAPVSERTRPAALSKDAEETDRPHRRRVFSTLCLGKTRSERPRSWRGRPTRWVAWCYSRCSCQSSSGCKTAGRCATSLRAERCSCGASDTTVRRFACVGRRQHRPSVKWPPSAWYLVHLFRCRAGVSAILVLVQVKGRLDCDQMFVSLVTKLNGAWKFIAQIPATGALVLADVPSESQDVKLLVRVPAAPLPAPSEWRAHCARAPGIGVLPAVAARRACGEQRPLSHPPLYGSHRSARLSMRCWTMRRSTSTRTTSSRMAPRSRTLRSSRTWCERRGRSVQRYLAHG
jgi:hypothetical protein